MAVADSAWPVVHLHLVISGGTCQEPPEKRSMASFLSNMLTKDKEKKFDLEQEDDIIAGTWMTKNGEVVHEAVKEALAPKQGGQD